VLSTLLELAGLGAIAAGVFVLAGLGVCLLVGGVELLFVGYTADGAHPVSDLKAWISAKRLARSK
jgi:hypothetical protein